MPTFEFADWLGMLAVVVAALFAMAPFVYEGARWTRPAAWVFGGVMFANGVGHLSLSVSTGAMIAGAWSSPVLLAASGHLLWVRRRDGSPPRKRRPPAGP